MSYPTEPTPLRAWLDGLILGLVALLAGLAPAFAPSLGAVVWPLYWLSALLLCFSVGGLAVQWIEKGRTR